MIYLCSRKILVFGIALSIRPNFHIGKVSAETQPTLNPALIIDDQGRTVWIIDAHRNAGWEGRILDETETHLLKGMRLKHWPGRRVICPSRRNKLMTELFRILCITNRHHTSARHCHVAGSPCRGTA
jgi:hypothetical protein